MSDYLVHGTAYGGQILAFACETTELVEDARLRHGLSPVATAALGRALSAAAMMGSQLKSEEETITLHIEGNGPLGKTVAVADGAGRLRGYCNNPDVRIPLKENGHLDVAGGVGVGVLTITKDLGLKEPYTGSSHLVSSEIAEDLAYYFTVSEQIPSAVSLGVMVNRDESVWAAGGFILQLLPGADDDTADKLQQRVEAFPPVSKYLAMGKTPEDMLHDLLGDMGFVPMERRDLAFRCNCSRDKVSAALLSVGLADLQELCDAGEPVEMGCHYCGEKYVFTVDEIRELMEHAQEPAEEPSEEPS